MAKHPKVTLEDRFLPATKKTTGKTTGIVWRVVDLFEGRDGIPYARLVNTNDRSLTKTVATEALLDRSLFRPA
ncbi:MAG: hypothetical protein JO021_20035 [Alphaproteobacteria bacterium]|nr:hypothetical protein [Alphaproteobacteria bacterium]